MLLIGQGETPYKHKMCTKPPKEAPYAGNNNSTFLQFLFDSSPLEICKWTHRCAYGGHTEIPKKGLQNPKWEYISQKANKFYVKHLKQSHFENGHDITT